MISGSRVAAHYQHQAQVLRPIIESYRGLAGELRQADQLLGEQRAQARRELAAVYLTELSDVAFDRVARLTGFQGFARRDPRAAIAHERHVLEQSLAALRADPRYANRDSAIQQRMHELDGAKDTLAPLHAACERFETLEGFQELVAIGYDTPAFTGKWWHASYWKQWAAGDRICKALGMKDFGDDVLPEYRRHAEPRNYMRDEVARIEREIDAIHELVREHDRLTDRLARLEEIYLAEAQEYLGEHLEHADAGLLEQWVQPHPELLRAVQIGLRKIAGLSAKKRFVTEIEHAIVSDLVPQLQQRRARAETKAAKFSRPKKAHGSYPDSSINREFDQKAQALQVQRDKIRGRTQRLVAAENYAGFDLRNDEELWWLYLMQSPPPRLAPSLFDYYQRRPGAQPITDPHYVDLQESGHSGGAAAAVYAAHQHLESEGYLS
jgi:hypothetical protein